MVIAMAASTITPTTRAAVAPTMARLGVRPTETAVVAAAMRRLAIPAEVRLPPRKITASW